MTKEMMQNIPGVYGRVCDLCKPIQKRFRVAMNVSLGGYLDAVLVDSTATCFLLCFLAREPRVFSRRQQHVILAVVNGIVFLWF